jgi:hypothetical protein
MMAETAPPHGQPSRPTSQSASTNVLSDGNSNQETMSERKRPILRLLTNVLDPLWFSPKGWLHPFPIFLGP